LKKKFSSVLFGETPLFQVQKENSFSPKKEILFSPVRRDLGMILHAFCSGCGRHFQINEDRYEQIVGVCPEKDLVREFVEVSGCSCCTGQPKIGVLKKITTDS
jgi:hypothetical protein